MKASNSMILAAATATSAQTLLNGTGDATSSSSVSSLVAAYEQLSTVSSAPTLASESVLAPSSTAATPELASPMQTPTASLEAAALPAASMPPTSLSSATVSSMGAAVPETPVLDAAVQTPSAYGASVMAQPAISEAASTGELPPAALTTSSLTTELNTMAAGYTQASLSLLSTYDSATRTYTPPPGLPTSYPSPHPLTTGTRYELSPDVDLLPTASLPSYVTTFTYTSASSLLYSTTTTDCGNGTMVFPTSSYSEPAAWTPSNAPAFPPLSSSVAPPAVTYEPMLPSGEPIAPGDPSAPAQPPSSLPTALPVTTLTIVTGTLTSFSTVMTNCGNGSMLHAPTDSIAPSYIPTGINTYSMIPSQPLVPTAAPTIPSAMPSVPLPEIPCSEATSAYNPAVPSNPAYTNVWSASESSLAASAMPTQGPYFLPTSNTTLATMPRPTASTPVSYAPHAATTTLGGGFSQGSGTADPGVFASAATSAREPSAFWMMLVTFVAVAWLL